MAVMNAVPWRTEGISEVFLDVIESVNMLVRSTFYVFCSISPIHPFSYMQVSADGNVVRSEILGAIKMKCYLSGMAEICLGLNHKVMFESTGRTPCGKIIEIEDVIFHPC